MRSSSSIAAIAAIMFAGEIYAVELCPASWHRYNNTACSGPHAYKVLSHLDLSECCAACASSSKCGAYTFHAKDRNCALIAVPDTSGKPIGSRLGCTCGSKTPLPPPPRPPPSTPKPKPARPGAPNIVFILTDDQDHYRANDTSLNAMPQARTLLRDRGATFSNFYVNTPVCCPSRSELFSGRMAHNIRGAWFNSRNTCMHMDSNSTEWQYNTLATGLQAVGYRTALFGKYLNTHGWFCDAGVRVPPGWDRFFASCKGVYYDNTWSDQGQMITDDPNLTGPMNANGTNYNTAIVGNYTVNYIRSVPHDKPFFIFAAPHAPHVGAHGSGGAGVSATPAKWYDRPDIFPNVRAPRRPNYNHTPANMHWLIAQQKPIQPGFEEDWIDELMRNRWRTLLSVDDLIVGVVNALQETGVYNNTIIFFTSDHGQNLGHYRLPSCKLNVYEHDVRVPLLVAGPGIMPSTTINALAGNTDLAPTILEIAGGTAGAINPIMDGKSLAGLLMPTDVRFGGERSSLSRDTYLIEYNSLGNVSRGAPGHYHLVDSTRSNQYRAIRVINVSRGHNILFAEFTDLTDWNFERDDMFTEMFNMTSDPWQIHNVVDTADPKLVSELRNRLHTLWTCKVATCP